MRRGTYRSLPAGVWALGFGSLFMDASSELIHSLLPLYMTTTLGASVLTVGLIEGIAEATASVMKVFSGAISDFVGRRKFLMLLGYGLAAATKPLFPLATSPVWVFSARFIDRIGKGIRGAPRDALVADIVAPEARGAAYGLRQALDSVGAVLGPLLAVYFMLRFADDMRSVMWIAVIPAAITVALLAIFVREPDRAAAPQGSGRPRLSIADVRLLSSRYWVVVGLGAFFTLARFSEAFLVLRGADAGLTPSRAPLVMIVMNLAYAALAFPAGALADRMRPRALLVLGLAWLLAADVALATARTVPAVLIGAGLWGLHMAFTQGLFSKLVADTAPARLRGTAFGVHNLVSGLSALFASVVAGALWTRAGAAATFAASAAFAVVAALGFLLVPSRTGDLRREPA